MVEPINMPFGLWTWVVPRNHVLGVALIPQVKGQFLWGGTPNAAAFCQFFDTCCLHGCVVDVCCLCGYRSLADVDNDGSLSVDEFCVAMHLVDMTKLGRTLPAVLPLDLVPPAYRTAAARSPLSTSATLNSPRPSSPLIVTPGLMLD